MQPSLNCCSLSDNERPSVWALKERMWMALTLTTTRCCTDYMQILRQASQQMHCHIWDPHRSVHKDYGLLGYTIAWRWGRRVFRKVGNTLLDYATLNPREQFFIKIPVFIQSEGSLQSSKSLTWSILNRLTLVSAYTRNITDVHSSTIIQSMPRHAIFLDINFLHPLHPSWCKDIRRKIQLWKALPCAIFSSQLFVHSWIVFRLFGHFRRHSWLSKTLKHDQRPSQTAAFPKFQYIF